jgi:hypothetical protein
MRAPTDFWWIDWPYNPRIESAEGFIIRTTESSAVVRSRGQAMVATPLRLTDGPIGRLEDYEANVLPTGCFDAVPEGMEWVDG